MRWQALESYDLAVIEGALSRAVEKAKATPEAFRAKLPKHARPLIWSKGGDSVND